MIENEKGVETEISNDEFYDLEHCLIFITREISKPQLPCRKIRNP
jgi:hypothetical protein